MEFLRKIRTGFYRAWFYVLMALPILAFFPILLIVPSREKWYPGFYWIARFWAAFILLGMGFFPRIRSAQKLKRKNSYMLVANHTSMSDIMLMLVCMKHPFVFVGKKELAKIPIFGFFYKRTCILVDRENQRSRTEVFERAQKRLKQGTSVCIFPEGGVSDDETIILDTFKDGAFRLAIDHQIPIVPITFHDNRKRFPYAHKASPGKMRVKIHPLIPTEGKTQLDKRELREETRQVILRELLEPTVK